MRIPLAKRVVITLCNIFFPPLAVGMITGMSSGDTLLNCCLFLLAIIPSHIHGFYVSLTYFGRKRKARRGKWPGRDKAFIYSEKVQTGGVGYKAAEQLKRENARAKWKGKGEDSEVEEPAVLSRTSSRGSRRSRSSRTSRTSTRQSQHNQQSPVSPVQYSRGLGSGGQRLSIQSISGGQRVSTQYSPGGYMPGEQRVSTQYSPGGSIPGNQRLSTQYSPGGSIPPNQRLSMQHSPGSLSGRQRVSAHY